MNHLFQALSVCALLLVFSAAFASEDALVGLLRTQAFNKAFEGFASYHVTIESDRPQSDGSREVTAVASGRFSEHVQRLKVLFLVVGDQVIGGQILEKDGLPPCKLEVDSGGHSL
jgi:hypothetical protein